MHLSLHDVKQELLNRTHECPLSICIKDIELAKSLYIWILLILNTMRF